ncbi:Hexaprenyldihydroxybenzoate methyltransferase, mitochondrial [Ascosphaera aggregata]|nr:Hexaprenyldihydroxybenzoate methyltransferase, mitochondrial [Ascosphaera aggregata]
MALDGSVSADEMKHFTSLAASWWDPQGHSRVLHLMNPIRHEWIAECLAQGRLDAAQSGTCVGDANPGLDYLDIGCGGGIFAESLARTIPQDVSRDGLSAITQARSITAIDPTPMMIRIATNHAHQDPAVSAHLKTGKFKYLNTSVEGLPATLSIPSPSYDVITLFEVLEHVSQHDLSQPRFLKQVLSMLRPGGLLIGSTIARAFPAYILHDLIAEAPWPVGVVPKGTHDWRKFVNPMEIKEWSKRGLREIAQERAGNDELVELAKFKSIGAVYIPGFGWKLVYGLDDYGNYLFAVQRT